MHCWARIMLVVVLPGAINSMDHLLWFKSARVFE